jgi:hypothetical protein
MNWKIRVPVNPRKYGLVSRLFGNATWRNYMELEVNASPFSRGLPDERITQRMLV